MAAALVALIVHLVMVVVFGPVLIAPSELPDDTPLVVRTVTEAEVAELLEEIAPEPEPKVEPEPEKRPVIIDPVEKKMVRQVTNQETPEVANFISPEDNKVEEETRARETTKRDAVPADKLENPEEKPAQEKPAPEASNPKPEEVEAAKPEETDGVITRKTETVDPAEFFKTDPNIMNKVLGDPSYNKTLADRGKGRVLMPDYEERDKAFKASLENFITEVKPGNHTGVNAKRNDAARYLGMIHSKIHDQWALNYLFQLDLHEPRGSALNNPNLNTKLEFVIRAKDGKVEDVNIVNSSGQLRFDAEAVAISHAIGPHPNPPDAVISPNGKVYVHWNFWRNQRQCGTFGASIFLVNSDG